MDATKTTKILGLEATLKDSFTDEGVSYELYQVEDPDRYGGIIRVYDEEAGQLVTITRYDAYIAATWKFFEAYRVLKGGK